MGGEVQLMHAGEEALFVLIPLAIVLYVDWRNRRKDRAAQAAAAPESGAGVIPETDVDTEEAGQAGADDHGGGSEEPASAGAPPEAGGGEPKDAGK